MNEEREIEGICDECGHVMDYEELQTCTECGATLCDECIGEADHLCI
jgi:hypothetical protein